MYWLSNARTLGSSQGCDKRKRCKVASFNEVRVYHNEIICKKKSVDSATTRISGYCKTAFFNFYIAISRAWLYQEQLTNLCHCQQNFDFHLIRQFAKSSFPIVQVVNVPKNYKNSKLIPWPFTGQCKTLLLKADGMENSGWEESILSFYGGAVPGSLSTRITNQVWLLSRRRWQRLGAAGGVKQLEKLPLGKENLLSVKLLKLKNYVACWGTREVFISGPFNQKQEAWNLALK